MKKTKKFLEIISGMDVAVIKSYRSLRCKLQGLKLTEMFILILIIGLGFTACDSGGGSGDSNCNEECLAIGAEGEGGGKIIYHKHSGFKVTGAGSFTAYYLEAAQTNQATDISWSSTYVDVTGARGTAIGTGKANTAAIIATNSSDTKSNNAAKAAVAYSGGGKNDWFLPSLDELNEMYKARTHLGISSGYFWSSSQYSSDYFYTCYQYFANGDQLSSNYYFNYNYYVRAVRAF